jgi:hypothetical protein
MRTMIFSKVVSTTTHDASQHEEDHDVTEYHVVDLLLNLRGLVVVLALVKENLSFSASVEYESFDHTRVLDCDSLEINQI